MVILIGVVAILLTIVVALLLAAAVKGLDTAVITSAESTQTKDRGYNPAATLGYQIQVDGDQATQIKEARMLAAKQAAATPRGANVQIGPQYKQTMQRTAFDGLGNDPVTAVKIAAVHGWDGVRGGMVAVDPSAVAAPAAGAPVAGGKIKLVAGKDYPIIEITDGMSPEDTRKARIANAKAKSTAMKAAKAAQESGGGVTMVAATTAVAAAPAVAMPSAAASGIPEPTYIEITDDMSPEDTRKARIANSKAKSAYNKALKAAGVVASVPAPAPAPAATPAPAPLIAPVSVATNIPKPEIIEITDDMSPEDTRKARIANSKAKSAYNKALKAAGIDPKSVS